MATIAICKELVRLCRDARLSLFLWGQHGLGKSALVQQVADQMEIGFVDLRCAQLDAVDLRGLPDKRADGRTHFLPPSDLPAAGQGILFLDELNRAGQDVLAALFQLVLDRRIGQYQLPDGWSIVAAGNVDGANYTVNELDAAFRDRFCHVMLSAGYVTRDEWVKWMFAEHGDNAYQAVNFCSVNHAHLEDVQDEQLPFEIRPSRRSWDAVVRGKRAAEAGRYSSEATLAMYCGLIGSALGNSFQHHVPTLRPEDLMRAGVRVLSSRLRRCRREEISVLMSGLTTIRQDLLAEPRGRNLLLDFLEFLSLEHPDLSVTFCLSLLSSDPNYQELKVLTPLLSNTKLASRVTKLQGDGTFLGELLQRSALVERMRGLIAVTC